ncbi:MAG: Nif3-like dinuclear metal center hexameric protein, partial [Candidatus Cloacimonadales bacterium]
IGNYSDCLNSLPVEGQFRPSPASNPHLGAQDKLEKVQEIKLEFFAESISLPAIIKALQRSHPYETPVYALYPQERSKNFGLGLLGNLAAPEKMSDFAQRVKRELAVPALNLWPAKYSDDKLISRVAVCGGSGSSLLSQLSGQADIFVSADFTYHTILDSKIPLIDAGHFYTEYPVLEVLENLLQNFDCEISKLTPAEHEISRLQNI